MPKPLKVTLIITGIIVLLLSVTFVGVNTFLKPDIKSYLQKIVVDGSDSLYKLKIKDYNIGFWASNGDINDISIEVDSARFKQLKAFNILPPVVYSAKIKSISVVGLSAWRLWRHKDIVCGSITIDGAVINMQQYQRIVNDTLKPPATKFLYELIKPDINTIEINNIAVRNADISYRTMSQELEKNAFWRFQDANITMKGVEVNEASYKDTSRILYGTNLHASLSKFKTISDNSLYNFSVKEVEYDFKGGKLVCKELGLSPAVSNEAFYRAKGFAADKFTLTFPLVESEGLNIGKLFGENMVQADHITLTDPVFVILKDKTFGNPLVSKDGKYPNQLLLKSKASINIKKVTIKNGDLSFTEKKPPTNLPGELKFGKINGDIVNITNMPALIAKNNWCKAALKTVFMNTSSMDAGFGFDLSDQSGHFTADADLGPMKGAQINNVLRALARAQTESFNLSRLIYHVEGNDFTSKGTLKMRYTDLNVSLLKVDKESGELEKKKGLTILANWLKILDSNPGKDGVERVATGFTYNREYFRGFFAVIWFNLFEGIKEIAMKGGPPPITKKSKK